MASLKGNHFLDFPAHIQKWNAIDRSRVDPNNPYGEGPSWANQINTMVWGTGGLDPAAIKEANRLNVNEKTYKRQIEGLNGTWVPGKTAGDYDAQITTLEEAKQTALNAKHLQDQLRVIQEGNIPSIKAAEAGAAATRDNTKATKEIAEMQLLSGDKNAAAERLQQLTMAENADIRAQQQWLRQMEYMDRKDQSLKEEKELETLIAGLASLGANLDIFSFF